MSYTILRILIFFAAVLLLALFGVHGFTLLIVAAMISAIVSLPLLNRQRDSMSRWLTGRVDRFRSRIDEGTRVEDRD